MLTLLLFALLAGALTAVTPCVLPVLPALLSAAGTGGRRRPIGVVTGLVTTHFLTIVALASVVEGIGLGDGATRTVAVVVLLGMGLAFLWPAAMHRIERLLAPIARRGPRGAGDGLLSGLAVGGALGFAYAPCAGPILAAVISVGATQGANGGTVAVAAAYSIGSAIALLAVALGGRRLLTGRTAQVQRVSGAVLLVTGVFVLADLDVRFQTALADDFPAFLSNPTKQLEESDTVQDRLADVRGTSRFTSEGAALRDLGAAPELAGTGQWFNAPPTTLRRLRGRVVLVDFWTYTCINCIRTLPTLRALDERYRSAGLTVLGVHAPEFTFEKDADNVADAVRQNRLRYPVVQDNDFETWEAFENTAWPGKYLIDARGRVRYSHLGEGGEQQTETAIRRLLAEAGAVDLPELDAGAKSVEAAAPGVSTPERYFGSDRASGFVQRLRPGTHTYAGPTRLGGGAFALDGRWRLGPQSALSVGSSRVRANVTARKVFLVLSAKAGAPRRVQVLVDGRPVADDDAGADVRAGRAVVGDQRLYRLLDFGAVERRRIELRLPPGVRVFAMTFG